MTSILVMYGLVGAVAGILAGIIGASVLTGVYLAHSLPVDKLKRLFAGLLLVVATRMLISLF